MNTVKHGVSWICPSNVCCFWKFFKNINNFYVDSSSYKLELFSLQMHRGAFWTKNCEKILPISGSFKDWPSPKINFREYAFKDWPSPKILNFREYEIASICSTILIQNTPQSIVLKTFLFILKAKSGGAAWWFSIFSDSSGGSSRALKRQARALKIRPEPWWAFNFYYICSELLQV